MASSITHQAFFSSDWQKQLKKAELSKFNELWDLKADWFEEPNIRRGGWSGVVKIPLSQHDIANQHLFIKRQENHISRTWRHPISGIPTFYKEYTNLRRFHRYQIPTQNWVYFGSRVHNDATQAILITEELAGFVPLDKVLPNDEFNLINNHLHRKTLLSSVAKTIRRMHDHNLQHNSLYPKHLFVKPIDSGWDVRFIDLEKAKRRLFKKTATLRDLATLRRHTLDWTTREQLYFFKAYVGEASLSSRSKQLWYQIQDRLLNKSK